MKQKIPLCQLAFLSICVALSLVTKRIVSPLTNLLTDLVRIPGGGASTAFSLAFLLIGTAGLQWRWASTAAAIVQGVIALSMGMSTYQGGFAVLTYMLPGLVMDFARTIFPNRDTGFFGGTCAMANTAGAAISNFLVFRLEGIALLLWLLIAAVMGVLAGMLGELLYKKLIKIPEYRRIVSCPQK